MGCTSAAWLRCEPAKAVVTEARPYGCLLASGSGDRLSPGWVDGLSGWLEPNGIAVHRASSGRQAIDIVERGQAQIAVVGMDLPRMDGLSVLRIIRSIDQRLPCVLVAGQPSGHVFQQALELEAYSVIAEPVDPGLLVDLVIRIYRKFYDREFPAQ